VIESFWNYNLSSGDRAVAQFHEWQTGAGLLQLKRSGIPVGTVFTTHATVVGRCLAGNNLHLYDDMASFDGDEMARRFNVIALHSLEKMAAREADVFTTVSEITARECAQFLGRPVDIVTPNGFENSFTPASDEEYQTLHDAARKRLVEVATAMSADEVPDNAVFICIGGRYEFRNKGIDVFVESMNRLLRDRDLKKKVVAFIEVPGWVGEPRKDLQERLKSGKKYDTPLDVPQVTHWLHNMSHDNVLGMMKYYDMHNRKDDKVKVIFLPCYLDGTDGIVNMSYYDVVLGNDLCIYPSYYEPWGYTPLEAVAFKVPCITTDLAGFGLWANTVFGHDGKIEDGVKVIHRTDYNYSEVADNIKDTVADFSAFTKKEVDACRKNAGDLSKKALWSEFIKFYYQAYDIALTKAEARKAEASK
jgi:glycosyltransferase involved in cell wall biosynthesis